MKKAYLILFVLVLASCSGLESRREVLENVFYATYPKMAVQIDKAFVFEDIQK